MNLYYVYTLLSQKDNKFYIGFSTEVFGRTDDHNAGRNVSTARRGPFDLIHFEAFLSKADALRRKRYFKTTKGKTTLRQMLREYLKDKNNPTNPLK